MTRQHRTKRALEYIARIQDNRGMFREFFFTSENGS